MKKVFLFALSLVSVMFAWAQTSPYTGSEAAAGNFYIYNVETGYWLQNNNRVNDWNSQVQVDVQGFDWELIAQEGGTWQLNPKFGNNHSLNSDADNGYMDTGRPVSAWTLTPVEGVSNGYTIESNGTKLGVNADKLLVKDGSAATVWQLVTAEERLAKLVEAARFWRSHLIDAHPRQRTFHLYHGETEAFPRVENPGDIPKQHAWLWEVGHHLHVLLEHVLHSIKPPLQTQPCHLPAKLSRPGTPHALRAAPFR